MLRHQTDPTAAGTEIKRINQLLQQIAKDLGTDSPLFEYSELKLPKTVFCQAGLQQVCKAMASLSALEALLLVQPLLPGCCFPHRRLQIFSINERLKTVSHFPTTLQTGFAHLLA